MKIRLHLPLLLIALASICWGASPDPAAMLEKSAKFVRSAQTISVSFDLKQNYSTGDSLLQQGELLLGDGEKFRLVLPNYHFTSDGETLWEYRPSVKQVLAKPLAEMGSGFHPSKMLFQYLECKALSAQEEKLNGARAIRLHLDPQGKLASLKELEVWLHPATAAPLQLRAVDASGNRSLYRFKNMKVNRPLAKNAFTFQLPDGVELLDLR
jgi:outer membrane lipoprotein carrier protein